VVHWLIVIGAALLLLYALGVFALVLLGRRSDARALAGFVPDCLVLFKRLIADPRVDRHRKGLLIATVAYLALPFDLVPDFIPVAGQLDDAIVVAVVLRSVLRGPGRDVVQEHWPGPEQSLRLILRLAYGERSVSAHEHDRVV
jgi:uncharacterized membrane protein YkvA (DUF1232 family)